MEFSIEHTPPLKSAKIWLIISSLPLIYLLAIFFNQLGFTKQFFLVVSFIIISPFLVNFRIVYALMIVSIFIHFFIGYFYFPVLFTLILPVSFILSYKNIQYKDFQSPFFAFFLIYIISIIPSLVNSIDVGLSILLMYNLIAFVIIIALTIAGIDKVKIIDKYLTFFLIIVFINSIEVIFEGIILNKRAYGFGGIMFVDFVGIAIVLLVVKILVAFKSKRIWNLLILLIFILASLSTQTRNVWITIVLTSGILIIYVFKNADFYEINKKKILISVFIAAILILFIYSSYTQLNPSFAERTQVNQFNQTFDNSGQLQNSLLTRLMIWHTSLNAFLEHPYIGIGAYSFPFSSHLYYTIPEFLFKLYVKGLSPHIGYLAVLTETGIIGFIGFLIFIVSIITISFKTIKRAENEEEKYYSLLLIAPPIYIIISLFVTDAWLWGQGIVMWGMFLGFFFSYRKIVSKYPDVEKK